jgi:hypothetical protein
MGMTGQEKAAIDEYHRVKAGIREGERYQKVSTPLRAVLSYLSGTDGLDREYHMALDVLRAPLPPDQPKDGTLCPVYMKYEEGTRLADTLFLVHSKGRWLWNGNLGSGQPPECEVDVARRAS